jgi:hypothetical protein
MTTVYESQLLLVHSYWLSLNFNPCVTILEFQNETLVVALERKADPGGKWRRRDDTVLGLYSTRGVAP